MAHQAYDPPYLHYQQPQQFPEYGDMVDRGINTLFIAGLPEDVKAREIHNLFSRRPGFDYCQLKYTGRSNQVVAFVTFVNHQSAVAALHALNRVTFDPQTGSVLHIELARSNSRMKPNPGDGYMVIDKRNKTSPDGQETLSENGGSESGEPHGAEDPNAENKNTISTLKRNGKSFLSEAARVNGEVAEGMLLPCSTLFIANLGPNCTEDELKQVLSQYSGFKVLKMRRRAGLPVAFADFEGIEEATKAMSELQGSTLPTSDRGGMHLEYARSKMRKP